MAWNKYLTVEVPLLLFTFTLSLELAISTNFMMYRTCYANLGYDKHNCSLLGNEDSNITEELEPKVQPTVNHITMVQSIISSTVPLLFSLYVGVWSDKFGRKRFLILSFLGVISSTAISAVIVFFENVPSWWILLSSVPSALTGGIVTLMTVMSAYLADVSTPEDRAIRMTLFDTILSLSSFVGNLIASRLFYATSYLDVYLINCALLTIGLLYTIFFIPESLPSTEKLSKFKDLFKYVSIKDIIQHTIRKRENNARPYIIALLVTGVIANFPMRGQMSVMTLFLRAKLGWTLSSITLLNSISSIGNIAGIVFSTVVLYKLLKIKEFPLIIFSTVASIASCILGGISLNNYYIYGAYALNAFRGIAPVMTRTVLSYIIAPDEMGKLFAFFSIASSIVDIISATIYPLLYNATLDSNPGDFNYLSAAFNIVSVILYMFMMRLHIPHYEVPQEQGPPTEVPRKTSTISIHEKRGSILSVMEVMDARTFSLH